MSASRSTRSDLVVVSNRLPVHRVHPDDGAERWETSPGGLVSALTPILEKSGGAWIGWSGDAGAAPAPFVHGGIRNLPVPLSTDEIGSFYEGFSNGCLWPLYHDAIRPPGYHRRWWRAYEAVNLRFAKAAADSVGDDGVVWVQDYHFQLVPAMLRELKPDLRIGFFLHIPFPPASLFAQLPWRRELIEGLLGADLVGFQTDAGAENFRALAERYADATVEGDRLTIANRSTRAAAFPISIDFDRWSAAAATPKAYYEAAQVHARLGRDRKIILGVDRMDYTKGIDVRLKSFRDLLARGRVSVDDAVFVQVGVPSRDRVNEYGDLRSRVNELVGEINGRFARVGRPAVEYLHRSVPFDDLLALYLAADVMLVTPLRDGMNLVAKEYVAVRNDETGALVLSEFTGSANELTSALLVNPHDVDRLGDAIADAIAMPPDEQVTRMRELRRTVRDHDVYAWADSFLDSLRGRTVRA